MWHEVEYFSHIFILMMEWLLVRWPPGRRTVRVAVREAHGSGCGAAEAVLLAKCGMEESDNC